MDEIDAFNKAHVNPYCEATDGHFLLHAQVGIDSDMGISPGTRIPIGRSRRSLSIICVTARSFTDTSRPGPEIFFLSIRRCIKTILLLDVIKGSFREGIRYLSFYAADSDVVRITGYLVKRSEIEKLETRRKCPSGYHGIGMGAKHNSRGLPEKSTVKPWKRRKRSWRQQIRLRPGTGK